MKPIGPETRMVALFGYPARHSISPAMHNAVFRAHGRRARPVGPSRQHLFQVEGNNGFTDATTSMRIPDMRLPDARAAQGVDPLTHSALDPSDSSLGPSWFGPPWAWDENPLW